MTGSHPAAAWNASTPQPWLEPWTTSFITWGLAYRSHPPDCLPAIVGLVVASIEALHAASSQAGSESLLKGPSPNMQPSLHLVNAHKSSQDHLGKVVDIVRHGRLEDLPETISRSLAHSQRSSQQHQTHFEWLITKCLLSLHASANSNASLARHRWDDTVQKWHMYSRGSHCLGTSPLSIQ